MALTLAVAGQNAAVNGLVDAVDSGTSAGKLLIGTSSMTVNPNVGILATLTFSDPAFNAASSGQATSITINADTSAVQGAAAKCFVCADSGGTYTLLWEGTVTVTGGGGDIELNNINIGTNDTVDVGTLTVSIPTS